jgi:hypothetical protein
MAPLWQSSSFNKLTVWQPMVSLGQGRGRPWKNRLAMAGLSTDAKLNLYLFLGKLSIGAKCGGLSARKYKNNCAQALTASAETPQVSTTSTSDISEVLQSFHGDIAWVHAREGYAGKAYWPAGQSGVTLDPGIDLGYAAVALVEQLYAPVLSAEQWTAVQSVYGLKGEAAQAVLAVNAALRSIRISRA